MDLLAAPVPALVVPFYTPKEDEQINRTRRLQELAVVRFIHPDGLDAERLKTAVLGWLDTDIEQPRLDLNGADNKRKADPGIADRSEPMIAPKPAGRSDKPKRQFSGDRESRIVARKTVSFLTQDGGFCCFASMMAKNTTPAPINRRPSNRGTAAVPKICSSGGSYASGHPCPMCFAAMALAGVEAVFYAHSNEDGEPFGLSSAPLDAELERPAAERSLKMAYVRVCLGDGNDLYAMWRLAERWEASRVTPHRCSACMSMTMSCMAA
ncbi:MAG: hypothetical protein R3F54_30490 [Alphaproteobacteria bacterium]